MLRVSSCHLATKYHVVTNIGPENVRKGGGGPVALGQYAFLLSVVAFASHLAWESIQCRILYEHGSFPATRWAMVRATLGDVVITWVLYGLVALISREWGWTRSSWGWKQWVSLVGTALLIGTCIELRALSTGRWSYLPTTPVVPILGVSIVALLQLAVLTPATLWVVDKWCSASHSGRGANTMSA